jgi:hypothetical protein
VARRYILPDANPTQHGTDDPNGGRIRHRTTPGKEPDMPSRRTVKTADDLLIQARAMLPHRPSPAEAFHAQANGSLLADIRGDDQRHIAG